MLDPSLTSAKMTEDIKEITKEFSNDFTQWAGVIVGCLVSGETIPQEIAIQSIDIQNSLQSFQICCMLRDMKKSWEVQNG